MFRFFASAVAVAWSLNFLADENNIEMNFNDILNELGIQPYMVFSLGAAGLICCFIIAFAEEQLELRQRIHH